VALKRSLQKQDMAQELILDSDSDETENEDVSPKRFKQ
jgi:hypothetical protein